MFTNQETPKGKRPFLTPFALPENPKLYQAVSLDKDNYALKSVSKEKVKLCAKAIIGPALREPTSKGTQHKSATSNGTKKIEVSKSTALKPVVIALTRPLGLLCNKD